MSDTKFQTMQSQEENVEEAEVINEELPESDAPLVDFDGPAEE